MRRLPRLSRRPPAATRLFSRSLILSLASFECGDSGDGSVNDAADTTSDDTTTDDTTAGDTTASDTTADDTTADDTTASATIRMWTATTTTGPR
ncbi:MAG: hypothetical protein ACI9MR_004367 [Myxococcota bacterium]|jgi:hypothetical protein